MSSRLASRIKALEASVPPRPTVYIWDGSNQLLDDPERLEIEKARVAAEIAEAIRKECEPHRLTWLPPTDR